MNNEYLDAAWQYIDMSLPVIALSGKQPNVMIHPRGLSEPLTRQSDKSKVWTAFNHVKTTGVGIVLPYPYLVVDIDGEQGARTWMDNFGDIPNRWVAKTGRGLHLWYACATPTGNGRLGEQLDLKGQGGYVVAPPSLHPDGHRYSWVAGPDYDWPPEDVPDSLERWIELREADRARQVFSKGMLPRLHNKPYEDGILYATHGWESLISGMKNAAEGNRNNYLHWAAATLAEEFATDDEFQYLFDAAMSAGLTPVETKRTIRSAMKAAGR